MTNITGKIYQMKNADGTENRFPRTVIEAVLGLSSYLQDQFSSLADIYMPIEGIYEALTGQEFVFRKSPNTIKAKSLTIDKIKGKTLAWNQICGRTLTSGELNGITYTYNPATGAIVLSGTATANTNIAISTINVTKFIAGHKYIFLGLPSSGGSYGSGWAFRNNSTSVVVEENGKILTYPSSGTPDTMFSIRIASGVAINDTFNPTVTDLTLLYGSEIDGITDEEILAKYEADFGTGYHEYNAGKLISNDASALETVGFNQWDEEWENGRININTGENSSSNGMRSKNYIPAIAGETYYFKKGAGYTSAYVLFYDGNNGYIGYHDATSVLQFSVPSGASFMRFYIPMGDAVTTYNHDICINLSNPAINGQYFPYWKRDLQLNITTRKDTDGNVPFADGMKGAGTAADWCDKVGGEKRMKRINLGDLAWTAWSSEIFHAYIPDIKDAPQIGVICSGPYNYKGNANVGAMDYNDFAINSPFFGRTVIDFKVSGYADAATFKAAMDGVMLDYEKATPVPFTWAEPLVPTVKAGTTEERISPNEDGLSAPFCCDITYSANENNDAGNAQYAATAGRLLNSHKIWGQDFNGSEDVDGNLVANGTIQCTQLKSTVATGTAPLAVSSTTMVQNLVAEKASKLLTARTIWGQSFDGSGNISGAISNITTISASGLATISGGIALGTSTKAQAAKMVWDETNEAWHLQGNLYADGSISAKGPINDSSNYVTIAQYNALVTRVEALEEQ